jgi:hypothetical protein
MGCVYHRKDAKEHAIKFIFWVGQDVFPSGIPEMSTARATFRFSNR